MSTHYDLHMPDENRCESCGRYDRGEIIPFAQIASGWRVKLHAIPERNLRMLVDWMPLLLTPGARIMDEYGKQHSWPSFVATIWERREKHSHVVAYPRDGWMDPVSGADMLDGEWS